MIFFYIFWGRGGGISLPPCLQLQFQKEKNKEKDFFFGGGADVNLFSMADFSMFFSPTLKIVINQSRMRS